MQRCPKCASQFGDAAKICRTCGAILESVAEESPTNEEEGAPSFDEETDPVEPACVKRNSWTCPQCGQFAPDGFEVCWNCGTSREGLPDPGFSTEPESDDKPGPTEQVACKRPSRACLKCGSKKIIPDTRIYDQGEHSDGRLQVVVYGDPGALIFKDRMFKQLRADICGECGHVELTVDEPQELYEHYLQSRG